MTATAEISAGSTPWSSGRFDGRRGAQRVLFGRTFEDPAIEADLFPVHGRVLCIASAGDTARALAASGRSVLAVDINPAQVDEVRRRLEGRPPRPGTADRLLALGRGALAPVGWSPARLARFCQLDDPAHQVEAWHHLVSPVVRRALGLALSSRGLRVAYGEAFAGLAPPRFGDLVLDRVGARIGRAPNRDNPWLGQLLTGTWNLAEPETGVDRIELRLGDVADVLESLPAASLDGVSLSNVLDGPGPAYAARLLAAARAACRPGAPVITRTFLEPVDRAAADRADLDRSLLWGGITVHR